MPARSDVQYAIWRFCLCSHR